MSESPWPSGASTWLGAGLAYYGVVTGAPLLVLLIGLAGLIVGEEARTGELARSLTEGLGPEIS